MLAQAAFCDFTQYNISYGHIIRNTLYYANKINDEFLFCLMMIACITILTVFGCIEGLFKKFHLSHYFSYSIKSFEKFTEIIAPPAVNQDNLLPKMSMKNKQKNILTYS